MRRPLVVMVSMAMVAGMLAESVSARTLTVRRDPRGDDAVYSRDILKVVTDATRSEVLLRGKMLEPRNESFPGFEVFVMDTHGTRAVDRKVYFTRRDRCMVSAGRRSIGSRDARRLSAQVLSCELPRAWFKIRKPVRFWVEACCWGGVGDRAPNRGVYVRLKASVPGPVRSPATLAKSQRRPMAGGGVATGKGPQTRTGLMRRNDCAQSQ